MAFHIVAYGGFLLSNIFQVYFILKTLFTKNVDQLNYKLEFVVFVFYVILNLISMSILAISFNRIITEEVESSKLVYIDKLSFTSGSLQSLDEEDNKQQ